MKAFTNFIQTRSSKDKSTGKKKVYVKGYASTKGLYDKYGWMKNSDGTYKSFNSLFTDACIEDMKRQVMNKTIFVDALHTIATDEGILKILKDKGASDEEISQAKEMLKQKKLPLAKPVDFDVDDNGFVFASETNPYFAEVDDEHSKYYDAITNSILDGYFKGYSLNFDPIDFVTDVDDNGNEWTKFDKINLYGISYSDQPALETNRFTEVAVRSMMEIRNQKGGNMEQNNNEEQKSQEKNEPQKEDTQQQPVQEPVKPEPKKESESNDIDDEVEKKVQERLKKIELEKQQQEQAKTIEQLRKEMDELRSKNGQRKGVVSNQDKYADNEKNLLKDREATHAKLKEITKQHELYMEDIRNGVNPSLARGKPFGGFGELVALQAEFKSHLARRPGESDSEYQTRRSLLSRSSKDDMVISREKNN